MKLQKLFLNSFVCSGNRLFALALMRRLGIVGACAVMLAADGASAVEILDHVTVTGTGSDATGEQSAPFEVQAGVPYVLSAEIRHPKGDDQGVAVLKPAGLPMYFNPKGHDWRTVVHAFAVSEGMKKTTCEVRQWHVPGALEFRNLQVMRTRPVYRRFGDVELGYGESMDGATYRFGTRFPSPTHVHSRALTGFHHVSYGNSTFAFSAKSEMTFRHELGPRRFLSGSLSVTCDGGKAGAVALEASADGKSWTQLLSVSNAGIVRAELPVSLRKSRCLWARLSGREGTQGVKIRQYALDAQVDGAACFGFGATDYADEATGRTLLSVRPPDYLDDVTSGERLPGGDADVTLWRQSSGRKVFRGRPAPTGTANALCVTAARNEAEAVQLVLRSDCPLTEVRASVEMASDVEVEVRRVGYLLIGLPMDSMGARGLWPDPLFRQDAAGCVVAAGENQPFWITVRPKKGAAAGVSRGTVTVWAKKDGRPCTWRVPLEVRVFDIDFPDRMTCQTSFGLNFSTVYAYHHVRTMEEKKAIGDLYLRHFAKHHVSPYHPFLADVPTATWKDKWSSPADPAEATPTFDWTAWDAAVEKALNDYHFNSFALPLRGKGAMDGISHGNPKPRRIHNVTEENPLFEVYMDRYLKAINDHICERGWQKTAYIYAFDEPEKIDYPYMVGDLARMRKSAPALRRMVTVAPRQLEGCVDLRGYVNLWCPITEQYDRAQTHERQAAGDEVWWYITFSSKPPKVNEHVEHSGVDMRVWLWQTWMERVTGVLIWETAFWNGKRLYPDPKRPQNPYEDTVCWGGNGPWNSGEGRYVYPPLACFAQDAPVIDGPTDSIRFEMLREGLEDYEYFVLLKKLDPKNALLSVPADVATSPDDYSSDPAGMERHRLRLALEIERKSADRNGKTLGD